MARPQYVLWKRDEEDITGLDRLLRRHEWAKVFAGGCGSIVVTGSLQRKEHNYSILVNSASIHQYATCLFLLQSVERVEMLDDAGHIGIFLRGG